MQLTLQGCMLSELHTQKSNLSTRSQQFSFCQKRYEHLRGLQNTKFRMVVWIEGIRNPEQKHWSFGSIPISEALSSTKPLVGKRVLESSTCTYYIQVLCNTNAALMLFQSLAPQPDFNTFKHRGTRVF